jgi:hypothetical protein
MELYLLYVGLTTKSLIFRVSQPLVPLQAERLFLESNPMYNTVFAIMLSRVQSVVQWAAVKTAFGAIKVPPQRPPGR